MSKIELKHIDKFYGKNHVLKDLNLTIEDGDFMTLLGPSGCGKTTTLRVVSGLEKPQNGFIYMDGKEIVNAAEAYYAPPSQRNLNLVFQSYALWPHMTVFENVSFGLKIKKIPSAEIEKMVASALERMQIGQYAKRYPTELSGGQQQRVAIARAIVSEPRLLLLDEPLSNLDAKLRVDMRSELKRLHHDTGSTIIYEKTDAAQVEARVYAGMPAGSETLVSVRVGEKLITVKELGSTHYAGDETVYLSYPPKKVNVFDASTKRLIKYSR